VLLDRQLIGIGIAMQGYRTGAADQFEAPALLSNWQNLKLIPLFEDRFELPVFTENNATSCATAEFYLGGAGSHSCFAYLSFNHGYGAGLYWQNKPVQGGHGNAGEIGSIYRPEDTVHRPALGELLKRMQAQGHAIAHISELPDFFSEELPVISDWVQEVGPYLRQSLAALKGILDPTAIFFGGEAPNGLRMALIKEVNEVERIVHGPDPMYLVSEIEGDAAHLGAAFLPLHQLIFRS
jgi:predicted NBD/HSP70 family sugar kinase